MKIIILDQWNALRALPTKIIFSTPTDPTIPMVDSIPISTSVIDIPMTGRDLGTENYHTQSIYGNQDENYHTQ